jgi:hypothetical protein
MKLKITGNDRTPSGGIRDRIKLPWIGSGYVLSWVTFDQGWPMFILGVMCWVAANWCAAILTYRPIQGVNLRRTDGTPVYLVVPAESAEVLLGEGKS